MARRSGVPAAVFREKNSNRRTVGGEISPIAPDFAYAFGHSIPPIIHLLFGPVTRTQCVHVAFCNTRRTHTVFLCVRHTSQLCKNRRTDRDAICATDSCGPRNLILDVPDRYIFRIFPWPAPAVNKCIDRMQRGVTRCVR